jgi:putative aldouronate transport system substrate-binding protein
MKMKKIQLLVLSALVASSTLLGACKKDPAPTSDPVKEPPTKTVEREDPYGKFAEEVAQTSIRIQTSWMTLDEGDDENNNEWTRYLKDKLNIKLTQLWTAPNWGQPFDEKVNIAITTDNLPDNIPVYTTLFYRIANGGKAGDLTEAVEKYASDKLLSVLDAQDGVARKSATIDGKLYGIGSPPSNWDRGFLWIRKDWLDKLNLQAPKTLDELYALAKAFATQDPNGNNKQDEIGIALNKNFFSGTSSINYLFAAYNVYPDLWMEKDGKIVRGGIQPEAKVVLSKLAELYKEKAIAADFAAKDPNNEVQADIATGKVGIVFGGSKSAASPDMEKSFTESGANWVAYDMPTIDGGLLKSPFDSRVGNFTAASAKNKHPEAVIKMINLQLETDSANPEFVTNNNLNMSPSGKMNFWCAPNNVKDPNSDPDKYTNTLEALKTGDASKLNFSEREEYDKVVENKADKTKHIGTAVNYIPGGSLDMALTKYKDSYYLSPAWGPETKSWMENGQDLSVKLQDFYIKAVMSGNVDAEFDNWVNYFNTQGGLDATEEVNEWYSKNK